MMYVWFFGKKVMHSNKTEKSNNKSNKIANKNVSSKR